MSDKIIDLLLVEDNPSDQELATYVLERNNLSHNFLILNNGADALDYIFCTGIYSDRPEDEFPRIILLDLKLPKIDGIKVLQRLKSDPRTKTIPVVVFTSSNQETDILKTYQLGVNSYIVKPIEFKQFSEWIFKIAEYWLNMNTTFTE